MTRFVDEIKRLLHQFSSSKLSNCKVIVFPSRLDTLRLNMIGHSLPQIYMAECGSAVLNIDNQSHSLTENCVIVTGQKHKVHFVKASSKAKIYKLALTANSISIHFYTGSTSSRESYSLPYYGSDFENDLINLWSRLTLTTVSPKTSSAYHRNLISLIFVYTLELFENKKWLAGRVRSANKRLKFEQVENHIIQHLSEDLSKELICDKFSISTKLFTQIFQHWQRSTFRQATALLRLSRARMLLMEANPQKVSEIAQQCGFNSTDHFIYTFKTQFGMTPYRLAKLLKSNDLKTLDQLQQLHFLKDYSYISERETSTLPAFSRPQEDNPTVCYIINESQDFRYIYELLSDGTETFLCKFKQHLRYRFNTLVDTIFVIKDDDNNNICWFQVEDKLCQALITH